MASAPPIDAAPAGRVRVRVHRSVQDRIYRGVARAGGVITLAIMGLIGLFLVLRSTRSLRIAGLSKFITQSKWNPGAGRFGIGAVMFEGAVIAVVAIVLAVPVSIAAALYITEYAPRVIRRPLTSLIDLLAAVPSLIYGLWGLFFLEPRAIKVSRWLADHAAFIPIFKTTGTQQFTGSAFIAGMVVALMTVPICTAVMREVFSQAPPGEREGALALGATRWGMIRTVVLPFGRGGMIGATMLGLGRALGETIAVTLIISPIFTRSTRILQSGANSIPALIALRFGEAGPVAISALMAAGLALFTVTLLVNAVAAAVVARSRSGTATEI
jgi:phosphate transport system permease protein